MTNNVSGDLSKRKFKIVILVFSVFLFLGAAAPGCPFFRNTSVPADGGVFKSDDGGLTWLRKATLAPPAGSTKSNGDILAVNILSIAVDWVDDNIVYAGTEGNGLLKSTDKGETWNIFNGQNLLAAETIYDIKIDPKDNKKLYIAGVSAEGRGRMLRSEDGGENWEQTFITLAAGTLVSKIQIDPNNTQTVFIITSKDGVFQSVNFGKSWTMLHRFTGGVNNFAVNPQDSRVIYAISPAEGLMKSTDTGANWVSLTDKLKNFKIIKTTVIDSIAIDPQNPNTVYIGYVDGMLRSFNAGETWEKVNILSPPGVLTINSIVINDKNSNNIYYTINSQVYITGSNGASNWIVRDLPTVRHLRATTIDPKDPNIIYMGSRYVRTR